MTTDLVTWLREQLDDDERLANRAMRGPWHLNYIRADRSWQLSGTSDPHGIARIRDNGVNEGTLRHIARHHPDRVLAEVDAKGRIMAIHAPREYMGYPAVCDGCGYQGDCDDPITEDITDCPILRLLALPYADRPGYRQEWRP